MPPLSPFPIARQLCLRPRPSVVLRPVLGAKRAAPPCRAFASNVDDKPIADQPQPGKEDAVGPNMRQADHVSEEAAKQAKIMGGEGPDLNQGTPVQDIVKDDKEARDAAPRIMKESIKQGTGAQNAKPSTSRSFSTQARRPQGLEMRSPDIDPAIIPDASLRSQWNGAAAPEEMEEEEGEEEEAIGHKFPLPQMPLPANLIKDKRYDPVVEQVTNLLMRHGKKATAQRNMAHILKVLRTSPPPQINPTRPLIPGAPPSSHLPLNPVMYLTLAIDSVAPLVRLRSQRGAAGGGTALQIPVPLGLRQRRRQSTMWIIDAASKRKSRISGKYTFAQRVAEEMIAVVEGRSGVWEKRLAVHRLGTTARTNVGYGTRPGFGKRF